jgi:hypothetical protein
MDGIIMDKTMQVIERRLPQQIAMDNAAAGTAAAMESAASSAQAVVVGNLAFNLVM